MIETGESVNYDALDALRSVLGMEFPNLIRDFREQVTDCLIKMELAFSTENKTHLKQVAHTLKGSALSLHCKPLADSCTQLERMPDTLGIDHVEELLEALRETAKDTLIAIEIWAE